MIVIVTFVPSATGFCGLALMVPPPSELVLTLWPSCVPGSGVGGSGVGVSSLIFLVEISLSVEGSTELIDDSFPSLTNLILAFIG